MVIIIEWQGRNIAPLPPPTCQGMHAFEWFIEDSVTNSLDGECKTDISFRFQASPWLRLAEDSTTFYVRIWTYRQPPPPLDVTITRKFSLSRRKNFRHQRESFHDSGCLGVKIFKPERVPFLGAVSDNWT
jgi:hypothetical protein